MNRYVVIFNKGTNNTLTVENVAVGYDLETQLFSFVGENNSLIALVPKEHVLCIYLAPAEAIEEGGKSE